MRQILPKKKKVIKKKKQVESRHLARELALQMLFQAEAGKVTLKEMKKEFAPLQSVGENTREFVLNITAGTLDSIKEIDGVLEPCMENWTLDRLSTVDRNILRMAVFEILHCDDIPVKVTLNEAIELAKRFGGEDSGRFINGVLDSVKEENPEAIAAKLENPS